MDDFVSPKAHTLLQLTAMRLAREALEALEDAHLTRHATVILHLRGETMSSSVTDIQLGSVTLTKQDV